MDFSRYEVDRSHVESFAAMCSGALVIVADRYAARPIRSASASQGLTEGKSSLKGLHDDGPVVNDTEDVYTYTSALARDLIDNTDYISIFRKLAPYGAGSVYFNASRLPRKLDSLGGELTKRGISVGDLTNGDGSSRIRESNPSVLQSILRASNVMRGVIMASEAAREYFACQLDPRTFTEIFPDASFLDSGSIPMERLREIDALPGEAILSQPEVA